MPARSSVSKLPAHVRRWLDEALAESNYSGYELLRQQLADRGYEISRSALHRYGSDAERLAATVRASTEAAKVLASAAQDDEDARSEAVLSLTQHHLFVALGALQNAASEQDAERRITLLSQAGKGMGTVVQSSIARKRFARDIRAAALRDAASKVEEVGRRAGLTDESIDAFRREILGIVDG